MLFSKLIQVKYYLPLWKNETTLIKLRAQLTYK